MKLSDVKPLHCQKIMNNMADEGYRTSTIYEAITILKRQKEKHKEIKVIPMEWTEYVFLCRKSSPIKNSTYDTALFKICEKSNIPKFSMHILRHTFATRCIEAGIKDIADASWAFKHWYYHEFICSYYRGRKV